MALSCYYNWDAFQFSETSFEQLYSELQGFAEHSCCGTADEALFVDPGNMFLPMQNYDSTTPLQDDLACNFQMIQEFEPFSLPKRQKEAAYGCEAVYSHGLQDFQAGPPVYSGGTSMKKSLSAQSIAARQRRRRITDKTQELGKLVPGGQKMNTAEMLHAAYKYIKFLQAQAGILEFVESYEKENDEMFKSEELNGLVESTLMQEKLFSMERCLVPQDFVGSLKNSEKMLQLDGRLLDGLRQLTPAMED